MLFFFLCPILNILDILQYGFVLNFLYFLIMFLNCSGFFFKEFVIEVNPIFLS